MEKKNSWHDSYELVKILGKGGNATVYFVIEKSTNEELSPPDYN